MRRILSILAAGALVLSACSDSGPVAPPSDHSFVVAPNQPLRPLIQDDTGVVISPTGVYLTVDTECNGGNMWSADAAIHWDPAGNEVEAVLTKWFVDGEQVGSETASIPWVGYQWRGTTLNGDLHPSRSWSGEVRFEFWDGTFSAPVATDTVTKVNPCV